MRKRKEILKGLEEVADKLGINVRYEVTKAKGGLCRVHDRYYIIIDKKATDEYKIAILAKSLKKFDLEKLHIKPKLREIIENY